MKDSSGQFVQLGSEFSVMTDTSDEEDDRVNARDELKTKLLSTVPANAIPTTIPTPVQLGHRPYNDRPKRSMRIVSSNGSKKKVRAIM